MNREDKNKWLVRAAALAIFLLGCVAGALSLNAYHARSLSSGPPSSRFEQMLDRLHLTSEQKPQVEKIFSDTREQLLKLRKESEPQVNEIRRQADERLQQVLSPEQWRQFQQMKSEMREQRRSGQRRGGSDTRSAPRN
jgi:Spy/CpxP family protein refolding chaperone